MIMRRAAVMSVLALSVLASAGCKKPTTGLRVMVTTDFLPSSTVPQLHSVRLRVTNVATSALLAEETVNVLDGTQSLPLKFSVFLVGAPNERVRIEAEAHTVETQAGGQWMMRAGPLTAARAVTGFIEGQIRVVPLVLYRGCWDSRAACDPDTTCGPNAMCQSAARDPNTLPTYDRDAGDSTDVFNIPMDASVSNDGGMDAANDASMDVVRPPNDVIGPPLDGPMPDVMGPALDGPMPDVMGPPLDGMFMPMGDACVSDAALAAPDFTVTHVSDGDASVDPKQFDLVLREPPSSVSPGTAANVEIAWLSPAAMMPGVMQTAFTASVNARGTLTRSAGSTMGRSLTTDTVEWLRPLRFASGTTTGVRLFALTSSMAGRLDVTSNAIESGSGLQGAAGVVPLPDWGARSDYSSASNSALATLGGISPNTVIPCYVQTTGDVRCYRGQPMAASSASFSVLLGLGTNVRLLGVAETTGMAMETVLSLIVESNGNALSVCTASLAMGPPAMVNATCSTATLAAGQTIRPGSASATWFEQRLMCPGATPQPAGWYVAAAVTNAGIDTLRAGRFTGGSFSELTMQVPGALTEAPVRTAVGVSPVACEMLVAHASASMMVLRRARVGDSAAGAAYSQVIHPESAVRIISQAPPGPTGGDMFFGAVISAAGELDVFRVPIAAGCAPMPMML